MLGQPAEVALSGVTRPWPARHAGDQHGVGVEVALGAVRHAVVDVLGAAAERGPARPGHPVQARPGSHCRRHRSARSCRAAPGPGPVQFTSTSPRGAAGRACAGCGGGGRGGRGGAQRGHAARQGQAPSAGRDRDPPRCRSEILMSGGPSFSRRSTSSDRQEAALVGRPVVTICVSSGLGARTAGRRSAAAGSRWRAAAAPRRGLAGCRRLSRRLRRDAGRYLHRRSAPPLAAAAVCRAAVRGAAVWRPRRWH